MSKERTTPSEQNWHGSAETMRDVAQNYAHDAATGGYDGSAKEAITTANNLNSAAAKLDRANGVSPPPKP